MEEVTMDADDIRSALDVARAIAREINVFRRDPQRYANNMVSLSSCYEGNVLTLPESGVRLETIEGVSCLEDCLRDLSSLGPLPEVSISMAMCGACQEHAADLQANDFCSHIGSDGSTPEARLERKGEYREQCGENVVFGIPNATEIVYQMLLDDGAQDRGHRANLINSDFKFLGVAHGWHPSTQTVTVVIFTDTFKTRHTSRVDRMRSVAHGALVPDENETDTLDPSSQKAWDRLMQELKPRHLKVPSDNSAQVHSMDRPLLYEQTRVRVPRHPIGVLKPELSVDPAVVRAFVHRVDSNHDDRFEESEILGICYHHELEFSPEYVRKMFDDISDARSGSGGHLERRAVDWAELFAELRPHKKWIPAVDVHVESGAARYQLTIGMDELVSWGKEVFSEYALLTSGLESPPERGTGRSKGNKPVGIRLRMLNSFLQSVLTASVTSTGELLQDEQKIRRFLAQPGVGMAKSEPITSAVCMGQRRQWAHSVQPHRDAWLRLFGAVGLNPLVPECAVHGGCRAEEKHIEAHINVDIARGEKSNVARGTIRYTGLPPTLEKMQLKEAQEKVQVRPGETVNRHPPGFDPTGTLPMNQHPWEEKRHYTESMVNQSLNAGGQARASSAPGGDIAYTFDTRRKFLQGMSKQQRASDEQGFLAFERSGQRAATANAAVSSSIRGSRGAGSHSLHAPSGVRGHFHNSLAIHSADGSHGWPQSLDVRWDGAHIDHARAPPVKEDVKFSKMDADERAKQFSTLFGSSVIHDAFAIQKKVAADQYKDETKSAIWKSHEFRDDRPARHGKFGRRAFDPQAKEKPVTNPFLVSEVENRPQEEFNRQQERVAEILDRTVPPGKTGIFKQYQPCAEQPKRHEELWNRAPVRCVMDGGQKQHALGFGQNRHSSAADPNLYTRPLGTVQMDRKIPLS